jgi:hypothetical protein
MTYGMNVTSDSGRPSLRTPVSIVLYPLVPASAVFLGSLALGAGIAVWHVESRWVSWSLLALSAGYSLSGST